MSYDRPPRSSRREYYDDRPDDNYDRKRRGKQRSPQGSSSIDPPPFFDLSGQDIPDDEGLSQAPRQQAAKPRPRSAMRDPDRPRQDRSNSQVRLQEPADGNDSDGSVEGHFVRHRDGRIDYIPDDKTRRGGKPRDLERKNGQDNRRFRERRNGYESDEGEQLKRERRRPPPSGGDDEPGRGMPPVNGSHSYDIPDRTRSRREDPEDAGGHGAGALAAGAGGAAAAYGASRGSGRRRPPPGYEDDYEQRPPPRRSQRPRSYAYDDDERHDRGYDSERPRRRRSAWDDEAGYAPPSRSQRPRDPRRDDRRRSARYDEDPYDDPRYDGGSGRPRRSNTTAGRDRRPRDPRDDPRSSGGGRGGSGGDMDWKGQGMELFKTHAMPVIRQEGGRFVRKQLTNFLANGAR